VSPEHRENERALAILAGLGLVFQLLPLWVGAGIVAVIVRRIAVYVARHF